MKKIIKKLGSSVGIIFNKEEQKIEDLKVNDQIEIEIKKVRVGEL